MFTLAFLEGIGSPIHWVIILVIALLLFGRRLPEVGRSLGKGITEFKKGLKDVADESTGDQYGAGNQQQYNTPQQQPQRYQGGQGYPGQLPPQAASRPLPPQAMAGNAQSQVRVSRNDMVD